MNTADFLQTVVTTSEGYFNLSTASLDDGWREYFYKWPEDLDEIIHAGQRQDVNVYFSAHLFSERSTKREYALPSRTLQADLDHANTLTIPLLPTVLVRTSPGRHQAFWISSETYLPSDLESVARRIAYGIPSCDLTGWTIGHRVRFPGTRNFKYASPQAIEISNVNLRELQPEQFNIFPEVAIQEAKGLLDLEWVKATPTVLDSGPQELLAGLKGKLPNNIVIQYNHPARDRSAALWGLMTECFKLGLDRDLVYHLATNSKNNKFEDRKYYGVVDLRKDILRAERAVIAKQRDMRAMVLDIRLAKNKDVSEKRKDIARLIINHMSENGQFIHARSGYLWYVRKDTGRPIAITAHSEWLNSFISTIFGLNATEQEQRFVVHELIAHTRSLPEDNDLQLLSWYDAYTKTLLLHTGGRDVLHITANSVTIEANGQGNAIFQWHSNHEPFRLDATPLERPWYEILFADSLNYTLGLEKDEAVAILRAWFIYLLFRNLPTIRPILAVLGQPGSGKTSVIKKIYRIVYGRNKSLSGITDQDEFDLTVASNPFVAFDNVDTWERWLPDKLALCASVSDIERRKLYTDHDVITMHRQAMVALTAHNPKFTREDVVDRLLLIFMRRLPDHEFRDETEILESVSRVRNALWNNIVQDIQRVLLTPMPEPKEAPPFRIFDFSYYGLWFARANGLQTEVDFRRAITKIAGGQRSFNLEEDQILVNAIHNYVQKMKQAPKYQQITFLWTVLQSVSSDPDLFKRTYRNAVIMGKKLMVMQASLKTLFQVEFKHDTSLGARVWLIGPKEATQDA